MEGNKVEGERLKGATLPRMPVNYVDVRFLIHATEDPNKVLKAVRHLLPAHHGDVEFKRSKLRGHYGNPITLFETRIKGKDLIRALIENLSSNLRDSEKEKLLREIDLHIGNRSLYLRLDKQAALQGELRLCATDPIRVRVRFRKGKTENIVQVCRELGILPA